MLEIGINTNNECGKDYEEICDNIKKAEIELCLNIGED